MAVLLVRPATMNLEISAFKDCMQQGSLNQFVMSWLSSACLVGSTVVRHNNCGYRRNDTIFVIVVICIIITHSIAVSFSLWLLAMLIIICCYCSEEYLGTREEERGGGRNPWRKRSCLIQSVLQSGVWHCCFCFSDGKSLVHSMQVSTDVPVFVYCGVCLCMSVCVHFTFNQVKPSEVNKLKSSLTRQFNWLLKAYKLNVKRASEQHLTHLNW